jgi:predicted DNA-binding protein with PD1-like motif
VDGAHEVVGLGIIAPDKDGQPVLHIHAALGRAGKTLTGCLRPGVTTWLVGEAIIYEITGATARRLPDKASGFELMEM